MAILFSHEMGHYIASRRWGVAATLPYFLPFPSVPGLFQSPIGTLGAVIVMRSRIPSRQALLDIGAAGPIAGFVVSVILLAIGMGMSTVHVLPDPWPPEGYMAYVFGDSLLLLGMQWMVFGILPPNADILLHPLARAGWVGLFVTALNLLPIGQLDGGHVLYAVAHSRYRLVTIATTAVLIALVFVSPVWMIFALMALVLGRKHPPPLDDATPIDERRKWIGYACGLIFILCFIPNPLTIVGL